MLTRCIETEASPGDFIAAVRENRLEEAEENLAALPEPIPVPARRAAAELHLRRRRWREAAELLADLPDRDASTELRRRLAENLATLQRHRPDVYDALINCRLDNHYTIAPAKSGKPTIFFRDGAGGSLCLSPGLDPMAAVEKARSALRLEQESGQPIALCGFGDGYLLDSLARHSPELLLGRQQAVFVIEPDPRLVMTALMLHDYSGAQGPIEQARFQWFVGPDWDKQMRRVLAEDLYLPFPESNVRQTASANEIEAKLADILRELIAIDRQVEAKVATHDAQLTREQLAEVFGAKPSRPPRVLLLTTRFSSVLQYSTADAAEALRRNGCETHVIIEPTPHHSLRRHAIRKAVLDFKADLVFGIDHLRHEYEGIFPAKLPYVCWIQDHLPNLTDPSAGEKVGPRDFVLTLASSFYVTQFGYPKRQIVDMPLLSRRCERPSSWVQNGDDLAYISNWSRPPQTGVEEVLANFNAAPELRAVMSIVCERALETYQRDESISTPFEYRQLLDDVLASQGGTIHDEALKSRIISLLFDRLNNILYRQQSLKWAAEIADQLGLKLGIYGQGWEKHPELSRLARGPVKPGADFEALVRRTKINLQLEPYACFSHPRLFNGLFAGGFFLVRDHAWNHLPAELLEFMKEHLPEQVETTADALRLIAPQDRSQFEALLRRCASVGEQADAVEFVRSWERAQLLVPGAQALPRLNDVTFNDRATLEHAIRRFVDDRGMRDEIVEQQRGAGEARLSYEAGLRRMMSRIGELIGREADRAESHLR